MSQFYSILRLRGDERARGQAKRVLQRVGPDVRLDDTGKGELCVDLSREREDWLRHQEEVAASLTSLSEVLATIEGCRGVVDSAINLTPDPAQILEVRSFRLATPVIRLLDQLGFEYEFSIYLSRE